MAHPLARDEDRRPDVEAEDGVLERARVLLAHEEADQARVRRVHLLLVAGEAHPRAVDDGEIAGHRLVEANEAVIQNRDEVLS